MIVIASDHGGYALKQELMAHLKEKGVEFEDIGTYSEASCNYPEYAERAARGVAEGKYEKGILVCGTGIGMALAADKIVGCRAANIINVQFAELCRQHNDANIITLSGRFVELDVNKQIVGTFLTTKFEGGRHAMRVKKIMDLDADVNTYR